MRSKRIKRGRVKVSRKVGTEVSVYISPIMLIMAVFFVAFGMAYELACSLTAVILHECAHARVAKKLGYALGEIRLMPYGAALCGITDMWPAHEIIIAVAGPLFNLLLGLVFAATWWLVPASYAFTSTFCMCNLYIGFFNLIPVYPLDGGRIAFALLSVRLRRAKAFKVMRVLSAVFGAAFLALFVLSAIYSPNVCFLSVGLFMLLSAFIPDRRAQYYALFATGERDKRLKKPLETRTFAVSRDAPLIELCRTLDPDRYTVFVLCDGNAAPNRSVSETELLDAVKSRGYAISAAAAFGLTEIDENT